jgi:dephospho-CoA kinase
VVIDADVLAREVVAPGTPGLAAVCEAFGDNVLSADGSLDRAALAGIVFADPQALARLNAITHPLIKQRSAALLAAAPHEAVVVYEIPLLAESGRAGEWELVVVVDAPDELRVERLVARGLSEVDARSRMAAQADRESRLALADVVVDNSAGPDELAAAVDSLWERLVVGS